MERVSQRRRQPNSHGPKNAWLAAIPVLLHQVGMAETIIDRFY
jgi:hypothetical protein